MLLEQSRLRLGDAYSVRLVMAVARVATDKHRTADSTY